MPLTIAIQMDAIESINIDGDTTFALMLEAQKRQYNIYYYQPHNMYMYNGKVFADICPIEVYDKTSDYFKLGTIKTVDLSSMDVILIRQDPPFNMDYLTYTYFLETIKNDVLILNDPAEIRNCPEKIFVCNFPHLMPPTLIAMDKAAIGQFRDEHGDIVLKPLYAHGGQDIYHITQDDNNFTVVINALLEKYHCPLVAQKYLSNISGGDKRIILINGEAVGAINRIPPKYQIRSNLVCGGQAEKTSINMREQQICDEIGYELKNRKLILAGIDVIDGYITEINVTSPTGIRAINKFNNIHIEDLFWQAVEKQLSNI